MERLSTKKRSEVLDIAKGFAMLMTIFCHALQRAIGNSCAQYTIWKLVHDWHMPMFFIISGYLVASSKKLGSFAFIRDKFFRLIYVWFIWRWLEWGFMRFPFSGLLPFNNYVPTSFMGNLLDFVRQPFRPMWFLFDLFLFFLILCVCKWLSAGKERRMLIWLSLTTIGSVGLYYICRIRGNTVGFGYNDWAFLYYDVQYFGLFALGFFFAKLKGEENKRGGNGWMTACAICAIFGFMIILYKEYIHSGNWGILLFWGKAVIECAVILLAIIAMTRFRAMKLIRDGLSYMGRYSMEYYTLQFLCMDCGWFLADSNQRWWFNFFACMVICTAVIVVTKKYMPWLHKLLWGGFAFKAPRARAESKT